MGVSECLAIAYALNLIDYAFTAYWVNRYGLEVEANPVGRWLFAHDAALAVKILAVGALLAVLGLLIHRHPKAAWVANIPLGVYALLDVAHVVLAVVVWGIMKM